MLLAQQPVSLFLNSIIFLKLGAGGGREGVLVDTNMNNTTAAGGSSLQTNQTGTSAGGSSGMAHTKTTTVTISPYMDFRPDTSTDDYYKDTRGNHIREFSSMRALYELVPIFLRR